VATVAASAEETARNAPGAFQLPPYKQARPIMWYKQAESIMDMRKITKPAWCSCSVCCPMSCKKLSHTSWRPTNRLARPTPSSRPS